MNNLIIYLLIVLIFILIILSILLIKKEKFSPNIPKPKPWRPDEKCKNYCNAEKKLVNKECDKKVNEIKSQVQMCQNQLLGKINEITTLSQNLDQKNNEFNSLQNECTPALLFNIGFFEKIKNNISLEAKDSAYANYNANDGYFKYYFGDILSPDLFSFDFLTNQPSKQIQPFDVYIRTETVFNIFETPQNSITMQLNQQPINDTYPSVYGYVDNKTLYFRFNIPSDYFVAILKYNNIKLNRFYNRLEKFIPNPPDIYTIANLNTQELIFESKNGQMFGLFDVSVINNNLNYYIANYNDDRLVVPFTALGIDSNTSGFYTINLKMVAPNAFLNRNYDVEINRPNINSDL